ncbi:MAG: hypothetical protein QY323_03915 [Patescibacteria group bacterium]|nr:MAG: hypothetical protein QY323_03915 [Patescibacteria group bacterium]
MSEMLSQSSDDLQRHEAGNPLAQELETAIAQAQERLMDKAGGSKKHAAEELVRLRLVAKALQESENDPTAAFVWLNEQANGDELDDVDDGKRPNIDAHKAAAKWLQERLGN